MRDPRQVFGQEGESAAERFLRDQGFRIVARNVRSRGGEMDLIAEDGPVLVFIEVKARRTGAFGGAPYAVNTRKQEKLIALASQYLSRHRIAGRPCRFDVVLVQDEGGDTTIDHIANAFEISGDDLRW